VLPAQVLRQRPDTTWTRRDCHSACDRWLDG
jgi:hypothetical protein